MPGLVGVVDRVVGAVDHANKIGHHMTYDAPFKALLPYRVYTGEGTGLRGYAASLRVEGSKTNGELPRCHGSVAYPRNRWQNFLSGRKDCLCHPPFLEALYNRLQSCLLQKPCVLTKLEVFFKPRKKSLWKKGVEQIVSIDCFEYVDGIVYACSSSDSAHR